MVGAEDVSEVPRVDREQLARMEAYRTRRQEGGKAWIEVRAHTKQSLQSSRTLRDVRRGRATSSSESCDESCDEAAASAASLVELRGYLLKRGQVNTVYQRRYFVLRKGVLAWFTPGQVCYNGSTKGEPKGWIVCWGAKIESDLGQDQKLGACHVIAVTASKGSTTRRILLACESRGEVKEWVRGLRAHSTVKPVGESPADSDDSARGLVDENVSQHFKRQRRVMEVSTRRGTSEGLLALVRQRNDPGQPKAQEDAVEQKPVLKRLFGIGAACDRYPESRLIYPHSPFAVWWMCLISFFLLYTAVVTPAVIAFHWLDGECDNVPTLFVDLIIDVCFLLDILLSFLKGETIATYPHCQRRGYVAR